MTQINGTDISEKDSLNDNQKATPHADFVEKQKQIFLAELSISVNVTASAAKADIPTSNLYYWRVHDPIFCAAWMKALETGYAMLEAALLDRCVNGTMKEIHRAGEGVVKVREYDNATAFRLLMAHKEMVAMTRAAREEIQESKSDIREKIDRKLDEMRDRLQNRRAAMEQSARDLPKPNSE